MRTRRPGTIRARIATTAPLGSVDRDRGPRTDLDAIAVTYRHPHPGDYLIAVDQRAVLRPWIQDRPVSVRLGDEDSMQPGDAWISRWASQVDLRLKPSRRAAAADAHLRPGQPELALGTVPGQLERARVRPPRGDHAVVVRAVGGHHRRPRRGGAGGPRCRAVTRPGAGGAGLGRGGRPGATRPRDREAGHRGRGGQAGATRRCARREVEPAGLAELSRPGVPALRAGLGRRIRRTSQGDSRRWRPRSLRRCADAHPAHVAEIAARRIVAGWTSWHPCLRRPSLLGYFLVLTVLVDLVSSAISTASSTFFLSRPVPGAAATTSTTLASSLAVSSLPDCWASATARPSLAVAVSSSPSLRASSPS